ncbi:MAG: sigma-70 family RNA polymerase sigma factor [Acidobacteria bacterium]|nr:sigma-70 family RNA polymerase sigma factor [Acidobacteriota bacterium]
MFKKTLLLIALIAALVLAALILIVPAWPGTLPTSVVPEGARWVAHLDMEKFVATKLYEYLEKDGRLQIKNRDIGRWLKIDLFKDIAGLTIFGLDPGDKQTVFAVTGKFDKAGLLALLALDKDHQEIPYGAYTLYSTGSDEFGAFINDGLIVFSENREAVEKVLDTAAGKTKSFASSKLNAAFKDVSSGTFLSGVVEDLSGLGKEINQSKFVEKASMVFFLAQEKQDNLQVRVQETFLKLYRNIRNYDSALRFSTWLYTSANRLAISSYRRKKTAAGRFGPDVADASADLARRAAAGETRSTGLWDAARTLGRNQHRVLWLRYGEDLTIEEIAASIGKSRLAVRLLLHRARTNLMKRVGPAPGRAAATTKTAAVRETRLG